MIADIGLNGLAVSCLGLPVASKHPWLTGAINICVQDANCRTFCLQGEGEIHGSRGFADTALTGRDSDDVFDVG